MSYYQAYADGAVIVWGGISATRLTELFMLENDTGVRYLNHVLQLVMLLFANEIGNGFVFLNANVLQTARQQI